MLIRGLCMGSRHGSEVTVVSLDRILQLLGIDLAHFRWLAAISGTDFHPGISRMGCVKALALVTKAMEAQPLVYPALLVATVASDLALADWLRKNAPEGMLAEGRVKVVLNKCDVLLGTDYLGQLEVKINTHKHTYTHSLSLFPSPSLLPLP